VLRTVIHHHHLLLAVSKLKLLPSIVILYFLSLFISSYLGYRKDNALDGLPNGQELFLSMVCFAQFLLLGTFAAILAAHRSEIIDKENDNEDSGTYETPYTEATN
jgi:hypothetical protein